MRLILAAILALGTAPALAQNPPAIGTAAAVNPAARANIGATPPRVLVVGELLRASERITTDAGGQAHVMFRDQSTITVGPSSEIVLDRFVYDPARGTGEMGLQMSRGVLRFVGGRVSSSGGVEVRTPVATIGIRGGVAVIELLADGSLLVGFVYGEGVSVRFSDGRVTRVTRAGFGGVFDRLGGGAVRAIEQREFEGVLARLEGGNGPPVDRPLGRLASGNRPPHALLPDWLRRQVTGFGGMGSGDFQGVDARRLEERVSQREGAVQRLRHRLFELGYSPPP